MDYIRFACKITSGNIEIAREILSQELADFGFESFEDTNEGLLAYIPEKDCHEGLLTSLPKNILDLGTVEYLSSKIKDQNWNQEWEKNFQPVLIANKCYIRAAFHAQNKDVPYEIVIAPKMAFGTGHHETTGLMIEQMLSFDFAGKQVLDMGCGTGVLAIMASMLKASHILAIDIDEWAYRNTIENCSLNHIDNITAKQGDIDLISNHKFDVILANINRNILLDQVPHYAKALSSGSTLLMSGIYKADFDVINKVAQDNRLVNISLIEKNNWIAVSFKKS
jgi:ribosomal protein L11 methyltransferase